MTRYVGVAFAIVVLLVSGAESCYQFSSCSNCIYDPYDRTNFKFYSQCFWCPSLVSNGGGCVPYRDNCTFGPSYGLQDKYRCSDMRCSLSTSTNNVYFCRGGLITAFVFNLLLLLGNIFFLAWFWTIRQFPWKYSNINDVVDTYLREHDHPLARLWNFRRDIAPDEPVRHGGKHSIDPISKVELDRVLGPGQVYFWSNVLRLSFFPFYLAVTCNCLSIAALFSLSLQAWYADGFYSILLVAPIFGYLGFFGVVYKFRQPIPGDKSRRLTMFFQLTCILAFRKLTVVFGLGEPTSPGPTVVAAAPAAAETSSAYKLPDAQEETILRDQTRHLIELETTLSSEMRDKLQHEIQTDEYVVWWEKPDAWLVAIENRWLLHMCATMVAFALWLLVQSGLNESYPINQILAPSTLFLMGALILCVFGVILGTTISGCSRLYVLTNRRTLVFARGILGGVYVTTTNLHSVECATLFGYEELGRSVLILSWDRPQGSRKLPPITTNRFAGVRTMETLLPAFLRFSPPLKANLLKGDTLHLRQVWRLHIFLNFIFLELSLLIFYFRPAPADVTTYGWACLLSFSACLVQRGLRMQLLTSTSLSNIKEWSKYSHDKFSFDALFRPRDVFSQLPATSN